MSSRKRASLSNNSPLDQLFTPSAVTPPTEDEEAPAATQETRQRAEGAAGSARETMATGRERDARPQPFVRASSPLTEPAPEAERELRQTTIMIYDDQADWLDEACYLARRQSGNNLSKAAILRALVDMAREDELVRRRLRERLGIGD